MDDKTLGEAWRKLAKVLGVTVPSAFTYDYTCIDYPGSAPFIWNYAESFTDFETGETFDNFIPDGSYTYIKRVNGACEFTNEKYSGTRQNYNAFDPGAFKHCENDIAKGTTSKSDSSRLLQVADAN